VIKLQCACGHLLELPANLAGKQVRCKRCNKVLKVPGAEPGKLSASGSKPRLAEPGLLVQGSRPCPGCQTMYAPSIVVCVTCGLNVESGAMLYASLEDSPSAVAEALQKLPPPTLWQRVKRALGLGEKKRS
jgi:hypothetical protein